MTNEEIIKIAETLLADYHDQLKANKALNTVKYVMTDDRAVRNGMDLVDPIRRFGNILGMIDSRVDEDHAGLCNWLHTVIVNIDRLERKQIVKVL